MINVSVQAQHYRFKQAVKEGDIIVALWGIYDLLPFMSEWTEKNISFGDPYVSGLGISALLVVSTLRINLVVLNRLTRSGCKVELCVFPAHLFFTGK